MKLFTIIRIFEKTMRDKKYVFDWPYLMATLQNYKIINKDQDARDLANKLGMLDDTNPKDFKRRL